MVEVVEKHRPSFSFKIVRWIHPPVRWFKCNTNGGSRGNPGPSSTAFCIRDSKGDFVVAKGVRIQDTTNLVVEARAIREGGKLGDPLECINGGGVY
ncbi:hypothetical protein KY285_020454 [Solanum tuberosum]|nr:hypothetical protein KY285_020454 [Solanum tuberosum]